METAEREAVTQPAGTAATPASSAGLDDGTSTRVGGVEMYESTRFAAAISLGKTVGVQRHRKWHPLYVAQIQAPSVKDPSKVHTQWLPKYRQKEHAALAYDIANTWRLLRGVAGVTEQKARFNFPQADYLGDKALCALLEPCNSFRDVKRVIKALLPPSTPPERSPRCDAGKGQEGMPRNPKTARSGAIILELTAAKLRDCRVYLHNEGLERAFPGAAGALATEQASENVGWADVRIQATAADPQTGEERVFELTFGVPGRDGLPVRASSLRPLLDLLDAQAGDVLQLQYTGYKDRAVRVRASLAARPGRRAAAAARGGSMLQSGRQQAGAAASGAELEAAADLLGMWQSQAEGLLPAAGIKEGTPSLPASPQGSFGHRKRTQAEDFSSGSSEQPVAKRRALEPGGSNAGFAAGLQPLSRLQPLPLQPRAQVPVQQPESRPDPMQQQQQYSGTPDLDDLQELSEQKWLQPPPLHLRSQVPAQQPESRPHPVQQQQQQQLQQRSGTPDFQELSEQKWLQPPPLHPRSQVPVQHPELRPDPMQQQQQGQRSFDLAHLPFSSRWRIQGSWQPKAVPAQLEERTPQPAVSATGTNPASSYGAASAVPGSADSVQQASALLAAALRADERRRPGQQVRAVMETLRLMGIERTLRKEYASLYAKLSIMQQEVQVLILEGLLRESDAAAEVGAHLREELAQQRQQQQQQEQQQPVGSSQAVHA